MKDPKQIAEVALTQSIAAASCIITRRRKDGERRSIKEYRDNPAAVFVTASALAAIRDGKDWECPW